MNCRDFESVVGELADGRLMDADVRGAGLGHAAVCAECAARLSEARGVGAALRAASRAEAGAEAPARVRHALLAAFADRERREAASGSEPARVAAVVALSSRRRRWGATLVAAAAALVLLTLGLNYFVGGPAGDARQTPSELTAAPHAPAPTAEGGGAAGALKAEAGKVKERAEVKESGEVNEGASEAKDVTAATSRVESLKRAARRTRRARASGGGSETAARGAGADFLPLTYLADATAMESGTVVRVELSRSALISLGVPLNIGREDGLLKADVVLGDDGVARAIRLVE